MKKLLVIAAVAASALVAAPASAQFWAGADEAGVGVQVGPVGVGVGPRYGWHEPYYRDRYYGHPGYYAYGAGDCRVIRERIVTPYGRVIIKTRRECY